MRALANLLTWLVLLSAALTLIWLVQMYPASVTVKGHTWEITTSLAVVMVVQLILLVLVAYGMLLLHSLNRGWQRLTKAVSAYALRWQKPNVRLKEPVDGPTAER